MIRKGESVRLTADLTEADEFAPPQGSEGVVVGFDLAANPGDDTIFLVKWLLWNAKRPGFPRRCWVRSADRRSGGQSPAIDACCVYIELAR